MPSGLRTDGAANQKPAALVTCPQTWVAGLRIGDLNTSKRSASQLAASERQLVSHTHVQLRNPAQAPV